MLNVLARWGAALCAGALLAGVASAAEVRVMISAGFFKVYAELGPGFEKASGHRLVTTRGPSMGDSPEAIPARLGRGEAADVVILDGSAAEDLAKRGMLRPGSKVELAGSLVGMVVREGAPKPDISSVDAFKKTLLAAKSVTYATQGASAAPFEALVAKLGITEQMKPKYKLRETASQVGDAVAIGIVELGVAPVSEILPVKGVDLVGPFPKDVQSYVQIGGAVGAGAKEQDAANKLLTFIVFPSNDAVYKAKGMER